ncbi:VOC family protein [Isobaculum melis]|uniref:Catechol 2,3-dioxygenase n=1 Tax=Isobaculum melis TaxID=142588 RepID=A0A1H9SV10_9LACT|nr:VOC family protein [Isobaculum melis]SER88830.1 catechol 2,3-dioxygenase [Isobaculum melis]
MNEKISPQTQIGYVVLKVKDLEKMVDFYVTTLGLEIKSQDENQVVLGARNAAKTLLILTEQTAENMESSAQATGLYHMAFLLPKRADLGDMLLHLLQVKYPLQGASDHGYSEALYLSDPEGNGIEIYRDKPKEEWTIHPDGRIDGITIEMDVEGVIHAATRKWTGMVAGTVMGHVHLKVSDLAKTKWFYEQVVGMAVKAELPGAIFMAANGYHHHIGANIWGGGQHLVPIKDHQIGLFYYTIVLPDLAALTSLVNRLTNHQYPFEQHGQQVIVTDPNGIQLRFDHK